MSGYPILHFISILLKILAVIEVVGGVIFAFGIPEQFGDAVKLIAFISIVIGAVITYAFAELIQLGIDVGKNMQRTAFNSEEMLKEMKYQSKLAATAA